VANPRELKK